MSMTKLSPQDQQQWERGTDLPRPMPDLPTSLVNLLGNLEMFILKTLPIPPNLVRTADFKREIMI